MTGDSHGDGAGPAVALRSETDEPHSMMADVSRAMVALYKEHFGRGPVKVRSNWAGEDVLVCTLEQSLIQAERNLRDMGQHERLRDIRMFFQYSTVRDFVEPVEQITGRTVRSFISGIDTVADIALETFVFYPRGEDGPSRADSEEAPRRA